MVRMSEHDQIQELLTRGVDSVYPSPDALEKILKSDKKLNVYMGIDPTADYIHLGHSTNYLLLERFHTLGHSVTVLVGDFTAMIGDPSDKSSARQRLSKDEVKANFVSYKDQISKILDLNSKDNPIHFRFNSEWLAKLTFEDSVELASNFTVQQMLERDAFAKRVGEEKPLYVHEFFYPLMQGYDSVALEADVEVGGTDQTFNMLAGRTLVKRYQEREKFVIATTLLEDPLTGEKMMSKSLGTGVSIKEGPFEMFAGVMRLPDSGIVQVYVDCTRLSMANIDQVKQALVSGENPRDLKLQLAAEIVDMYHGKEAAAKARQDWLDQVSGDELPDDMPLVHLPKGTVNIVEVVSECFELSKSEVRRLLEQRGVKINSEVVEAEGYEPRQGDIIQVGKRRFKRVALKG